jgi:hypothetical protein
MKLDLNSGTYIEIGGELGKYNSLPIDTLIKIAQDLQELVMTIAKYDLPANDTINLDNFKIELVGFRKGSAVPKFAFTPRVENKVGPNWEIHRNVVSEKFEKLVEISNSGDYEMLKVLYPEPVKRNPIVENLYSFVNDFGSSPVNFVDIDNLTEKITPVFKINRFKAASKKELITVIKENENAESETDEAVGKIKITTKGGKISRKIIDSYSKSRFSLEYAPEIIIFGQTKYVLKYPLRCLFEKEDGYFIIQSEMLGIIGTGLTEDEAETTFAEEFNFVYQRFNSLDSKSLTNNNQLIKNILNQIVEKVEK